MVQYMKEQKTTHVLGLDEEEAVVLAAIVANVPFNEVVKAVESNDTPYLKRAATEYSNGITTSVLVARVITRIYRNFVKHLKEGPEK